MSASAIALVSDAAQARAALTPLRRKLLERLRQPGSAASLAQEMDIPRQKLGYHLRELEAAGLIELVEERPRRGFTERILRACADAFVVDPGVMGTPAPVVAQDRFASDHLVRTAAGMVRDVARMRAAADQQGVRLLTVTIEANLTFAEPQDFDRFAERLSKMVTKLACKYNAPKGRRYRLVAATHPATHTRGDAS